MADPVDPKSVKAADDFAKALDKSMKSLGRRITTTNKLLAESVKLNMDSKNATEKNAKATAEYNEELEKSGEALDEVNKEMEKTNNELDEMNKQGYNPKKIKKYNEMLKKQREELKKIAKSALDPKKAGYAQDLKNRNVRTKALAASVGQLKTEILGVKKTDRPLVFAKSIGKTLVRSASAGTEAVGFLGNAMKGLAGSFGPKLLGPIGMAVAEGVKAIWNIGMAADQFVKDANKSFATVRGPDIMTADVEKQFKDFNNQIYNTGENIRTGLNVVQIRELMGAMSQAGLNITTLNKGITNYRESIYIASKASKALGLDLTYTGSMIGKMVTDFRMDLKKIDKAFNEIAFDAQKSGLSTDRFWNVVQNANASLALYGVALGAASKTMKKFTEDQVGGADDAAAATEDMFNAFKSGTKGSQAAILDFATRGGADINKAFTEQIENLKAEQGKITGKIQIYEKKGAARTSAESQELEKLRKQLYNSRATQKRFESVLGRSSIEQTTEMGALAKDAPEILLGMMKTLSKIGKDGDLSTVTGQEQLTLIQAMQGRNVSEKTVKMLLGEAGATKEALNDLSAKTTVIAGLGVDEKKAIVGVSEKTGDKQIDAINEITKSLTPKFGEGLARKLAEVASISKKNEEAIVSGDKKLIKGILQSGKTASEMTVKGFKASEATQGDMADAAKDTLKGVVDQTLSFKEMQDIAGDEIKWRLNSLNLTSSINRGVFNIFKFLIRNDKKYVSASEKEAQQMALQDDTLKGLLKTGNDGNVTVESQRDAIITLSKKMKDLEAQRKGLTQKGTKLTEEQKKNNEKLLAKNTEELEKTKLSLTTLTSLNETNEKTAKIQELMAGSNEDVQKYLSKQAVKAVGGKDSEEALKQLSLTTGMSYEKIQEAIAMQTEDLTPEQMKAYNELEKMKRPDKSYNSALRSVTYGEGARANLRAPEMVTAPGVVKLDPGELIMPKGYMDIKTLSVGSSAPLGQPGGETSGKNISISVSATEKDLAMRIANEVRKVMYSEYQTGMG